MPLGTILAGGDLEVSSAIVAGTAPTYTGAVFDIIDGLNTFTKNATRQTQSFPTFNRDPSPSVVSPREVTYSIGGFASQGDSGQDRVRTAAIDGTTTLLKVIVRSTPSAIGYIQPVKYGTTRHDAAPENFQGWSVEAAADGVESAVGTGGML